MERESAGGRSVLTMEQLPLEVRLSDYARFNSFFVGPNAAAVHALSGAASIRSRAMLWLWGPAGVGKTHLLQACVTAANDNGFRAVYLPLGRDTELRPAAVEGMGELDVVCVDDVGVIAGQPDWERALLMLFESARASDARLIMSASQAPAHCFFELADLESRFGSAAAFRLQQLSDEEKLKALQLRAKWRGFVLPDDTAGYLMKRADRSSASLFTLLDKLDREALVAQKKLSVAFVKTVLNS